MPANKYALLRYRIIDRCLNNKFNPFPSKDDLREACEEALYGSSGERISSSTIEKDLWAMRNESELGYYAPIAYNKEHRGYEYTEDDYSINDISLNEEDLQAIHIAAHTLFQFRNIPLFDQYEHAIEKIMDRLSISPSGLETPEFIQFESAPPNKGNQWLSTLLESIRNKQSVALNYKKFSDDTEKEYHLNPYLLREYRNRWYLIAWNEKRRSIQTFGLERVLSILPIKSNFEKPSDFSADRFFKHSIGITEIKDEPTIVQLELKKLQGKYLLSQPIHNSQKLIQEDENTMTFEFYVYLTYELKSFILSQGQNAKVIKPDFLKTEIRDELIASAANYQ